MDDLNKIFVYGTLKEGGFFARHFDSYRISSERATIKGTMISLGEFPGIVLQGDGEVVGELHEYSSFDNVLEEIDRIEGCSGENEDPDNLYHRKAIKVLTDSGEKEAWIYVINTDQMEILHYEVVKNGEWKIN